MFNLYEYFEKSNFELTDTKAVAAAARYYSKTCRYGWSVLAVKKHIVILVNYHSGVLSIRSHRTDFDRRLPLAA